MRTLAVVEHGTGGILSYLLTTAINGSSVFHRGWISQNKKSLIEELAVPLALIEQHGIYSQETARTAALNARRNADANIGIAILANAGPRSDDGAKAGTVLISISHGTSFSDLRHELKGTPEQIRSEAVVSAIMLVEEAIRYFV